MTAVIYMAETMMISKFKLLTRLDLSSNYIEVRGAEALAEVVACTTFTFEVRTDCYISHPSFFAGPNTRPRRSLASGKETGLQ